MFYHNGHRSNAHLGIHHPFGAKHGTPVPPKPAGRDGRPLHERMYAPSAAVLLRQPVPQPADAPLHDRLYPEIYEEFFARITTQGRLTAADEHGRALIDAGGRHFDAKSIRRDHVRNKHRDLAHYMPEPDAPVPYYRIGVRPLAGLGSWGNKLYGCTVPPSDSMHAEHMHFLGSDGSNFGLSKDGTGVDGVFSEHREALQKYAVEPRKYRKDYIDRAKAQVDARWRVARVEAEATGYYGRPRYGILRHNCQHYVAEIMQLADELARKDGVSLIIK